MHFKNLNQFGMYSCNLFLIKLLLFLIMCILLALEITQKYCGNVYAK